VLSEHAVPIAPSGYYAFKKRAPSARSLRYAELIVEIERLFWDRKLGRGISGARKVWRLLRREDTMVAPCTVERLMRQQGLRGIRRDKQFVTTRPDGASFRPPDHVQRCFRADRPNEFWVVDFTYVPTWSGMSFTGFVTDVFSRRVVGWRTMDYAERLADVGAIAPIGTVGDSFDNALAETVVGLYKTDCVKIDGPFRTADELELATLSSGRTGSTRTGCTHRSATSRRSRRRMGTTVRTTPGTSRRWENSPFTKPGRFTALPTSPKTNSTRSSKRSIIGPGKSSGGRPRPRSFRNYARDDSPGVAPRTKNRVLTHSRVGGVC